MKKLFHGLIILLLTSGAHAADINTAGKILLLDPGAHSLGLAGCGTFLGEASSGLYNPAALDLAPDVTGSIYLNPHPAFGPNYDFMAVSAGARSEFGYIGFSYLIRKGVEGTEYPDEEASALIFSGKPSQKLNLLWGIAFKILNTRKANFIPLNESWSNTYKMAFDLGLVYAGLFPHWTLGTDRENGWNDANLKLKNPSRRGVTLGIAFQNLGGGIKYDYALDVDMLPQTFRADLLWEIYRNRIWKARLVGQLQKLLVARKKSTDPQYEAGGYNSASDAFFNAWGGGALQGGWTSRLGGEISGFGLICARLGWSKEYHDGYAFHYYGLGLGPEWLRANVAWEHFDGGTVEFTDELRYDISVRSNFKRIRDWINP